MVIQDTNPREMQVNEIEEETFFESIGTGRLLGTKSMLKRIWKEKVITLSSVLSRINNLKANILLQCKLDEIDYLRKHWCKTFIIIIVKGIML